MRLISILSVTLAAIASASLTACSAPGKQRGQQAQALFEDRCKNVAGEKIYRKINNVEGILLLKVPPRASDTQWRDRMWPSAAFAHERAHDEAGYIQTFLFYEAYVKRNDVAVATKNGLTTDKTDLPGYRFVDAIDPKDGVRYRYTLIQKPRPTSKIGWIDTLLDRQPAKEPAPRYGVTYEDYVIPQERALGLASSTVKVLDLQTNEVLGEFTRYVIGGGFDHTTAQNSSPWLTAYQCGGHSSSQPTRFFVDQVLIPRQEN